MNILTGNNRDLKATGSILADSKLAEISGYVRQEDLFLGELTVLEHLRFRARMMNMSPTEQDIKIKKILDQFQLTDQAFTQIGTPGIKKTLSGGERKRLSLGTEILADPRILFCDEPTTGLDSTMAQRVITILEELRMQGMTIVCTIHQPSSKIFSIFSHIMLMSQGEIAFLGTRQESVEFYHSMNKPVPPLYNPADHYVDLLDPYNPKNHDFIDECIKKYKCSTAASVDSSVDNIDYEVKCDVSSYKTNDRPSWSRQVRALVWRQYVRMFRDPLAIKAKIVECLFIAFWYGAMYYRADNPFTDDDYKYTWSQVKDINGSMVVSLLFISVLFIVMVALRFMLQWPLLQREVSDSLFSFSAFFTADNIVSQSFAMTLPLLYSIVAYPLFGLQKSLIPWFNFYWILVIEGSVCLGVGYFISSFSPNIEFTIAMLPAAIVPLIVFCGYLMDAATIPKYIGFLKYISWYGYCNELMQINQWHGMTSEDLCHSRPSNSTGWVTIEFQYNGPFGPYNAVLKDHDVCRVRYPDGGVSILKEMGFHDENWYFDIAALIAIIVVSRLVAYFIFAIRLKKLEKKILLTATCTNQKVKPLNYPLCYQIKP